MYCSSEVEILCKYYFGTDDKKKTAFVNEWNSFKFELISEKEMVSDKGKYVTK